MDFTHVITTGVDQKDVNVGFRWKNLRGKEAAMAVGVLSMAARIPDSWGFRSDQRG